MLFVHLTSRELKDIKEWD